MTGRLPIDALEDFALQLREKTDAPAPVPHGHRERRRRTIAALIPAAASAAAALVIVLPGGARPDDAIAKARTALDPTDTILRYTYTTTGTFTAPGQSLQRLRRTEATAWSTPGRWRFRNPHHLQSGRANGAQESSFVNGVATVYTTGAHSQRVTIGITNPRAAVFPDLFGSLNLRETLARGEVTDLGTRVRDGREVRRLVSVQRRGRIRRIENRIVYDVDPVTYAPRHIHLVSTTRGRHSTTVSTSDIRVTRFDRLPRTAANLRLFTIPIPPGTAITKYRAINGGYGTRKICARPAQQGVPLCP